ncbi:hypothetical protein SVIO_065480 [Streptomyces violaceusniger]|uniref:Uncharacterized protein n=1 Tax=Streptomyces violaceusniger TaxID=68280 RepID=A0A4D4L4B5_STRVO|nr:hypothetical protein SVIO_065480 [Streptomyces violaceusniger]
MVGEDHGYHSGLPGWGRARGGLEHEPTAKTSISDGSEFDLAPGPAVLIHVPALAPGDYAAVLPRRGGLPNSVPYSKRQSRNCNTSVSCSQTCLTTVSVDPGLPAS